MTESHPLPNPKMTTYGPASTQNHHALVEWNDTTLPGPRGLGIHDLVIARAEEAPGTLAVVGEEVQLTYGELVDHARRLSERLRSLGVGPETVVALYCDRHPHTLAAMLGVLEAGAAYLPLDPTYPEERLRFLLEDAAPQVLIADRPIPNGFRSVPHYLDLTDAWKGPAAEPRTGPLALAESRLAYVIYTSGSTGRPKGVEVPHRGLLNLAHWFRRHYSLSPGERTTQVSALGFDASVFEIWPTLAAGATLYLVPEDLRRSPAELPAWWATHGINVVYLPTPLAEAVLQEPWPRDLKLRALCTAGDRLHRAALETLRVPLDNLYGPTEGTVMATHGRVVEDEAQDPTIGRPMINVRVHVLDRQLRSAAPGEEGELCIAGIGVARGYRGRPARSAQSFVPDPFAVEPGRRLYRTGDRVRHRPDGELEFLGRIDHQVKIRGVRVEVGEVEAVLGEHPAVRSVAVVAPESAGQRALVAWVVSDAGEAALDGLRAFAQERLPEVLVPAAFAVLDDLPLTENGKVDRRALLAQGVPAASADAGEAPQGELEIALAEVAGELLSQPELGRHQDLFELGAYSLLVARLVAQVRARIDRELTHRAVFEERTVAGLAAWLESKDRRSTRLELPPIERQPHTGPLPWDAGPPSFPQERIWFLTQLEPDLTAYNAQCSIRFRGPFNPDWMDRSLTEIVRRHEVMRTTFPAVDGRPMQRVHAPYVVRCPRVDLRGLPPERRDAEVKRGISLAMRKSFDVRELPLLGWWLFQRHDHDQHFFQIEHHFVHDGWSTVQLFREFEQLYSAYSEGREPNLPEASVQYPDYCRWQRQWLTGEVLENQLDFWMRRLEGRPNRLELPTDRPRPEARSFRGGALMPRLDPQLYHALRRRGRVEGASLYIATLTAFDILLYQHSGQHDLVLASGFANRRREELESMLGMVVNTVVMRFDLSGDPTLRELLARIRHRLLEAQENQDLPFEKLVERLQPERRVGESPIFQILFSFHDSPMPDLNFAGLEGEFDMHHNGTSKADLNIVGIPRAEQRVGQEESFLDDEMRFIWEYDAALFDRTTMLRMWRQYELLLKLLAEDPSKKLSEIPRLHPAERHQLRVEWNDTHGLETPPNPLAEFLDHAHRQPHTVAAAGPKGDVHLTYGRLLEEAQGLAGELQRQGVEAETLVGLLSPPSPELLVGMVATGLLGAAYVPLDPAWPENRLAFVLADTCMPALLVHRKLRKRIPAGCTAAQVLLGATASTEPAELEGAPGSPEHGAYVIYTSGSTGRPKGVVVPHRGLANLVAWHRRRFALAPGDATTQVAGLGFDASVWEMWPTLAAGATLHFAPSEIRASAAALYDWMTRLRVRVAFLPTPSAEALLLENRPRPTALRALLTGGDRLHRTALEEARCPVPLYNQYGPTEGTVVSTWKPVNDLDRKAAREPSIGGPIDEVEVLVLDHQQQPVAPGAFGELHIAGASLARGYLGRPGLTAERFVPHPEPQRPGQRLYRTGDRTRWLVTGQLEFLGRLDAQVKVRGYRIELGEIEAVLREHDAVRQAVVTVYEGPAGNRLAAYLQGDADLPDEGVLAEWLRRRLPTYMVPSAFVVMDDFPLNASGKVDRAALPSAAPDSQRGEGPQEPRTPEEEILADLWSEVLGVETVGPADDFFALGGHSLLATQVVARLERTFDVSLPLRALFETPILADLARRLRRLQRAEAEAESIPPLVPLARPEGLPSEPPPLSFAQERLFFLDRLVPGSTFYNVPVLRAFDDVHPPSLEHGLSEVVRRHEALRTRFPARHGKSRQAVESPWAVPLPVIDLSALGAEPQHMEAGRLATAFGAHPFDLEHDRLLRAHLLHLEGSVAGGRALLHLALHHIVADGWSVGLILDELGRLHRAFAQGHPSPLPEPTLQYADFAVWQRSWLRGEVLDRQLAWWRERLLNVPPLELPTDHPPQAIQRFRGRRAWFRLDPDLTERLRAFAQDQGATLFMTLLAAFEALLYRWCGQGDLAVGTPIANRQRIDLEGVVGFFVNSLVLRTQLDTHTSFRELLARVRTTALGAYAHQDVPFEKLVEEIHPERTVGNPLFQVMFALQNAPSGTLGESSAALEDLPVEIHTTHFDLEWNGWLDSDGLGFVLGYDRDLFHDTTIERLGRRFQRLLTVALEEPEATVSHLPLLAPGERQQLLWEWNDTAVDLPEGSLSELFARAAEARPNSIALAARDQVSYGALLLRVRRLAQALRKLGVGPGVRVSTLLPRSPEVVTTFLAILEAGGVYVPLDPSYPESRLVHMLVDCGAHLLLTDQQHLMALGSQIHSTVRVVLPERLKLPEKAPAKTPALPPEALAYLMYTSGSTGQPKGIAVPHRAVMRLVLGGAGPIRFGPEETQLLFAPVSFDASTLELWGALLHGARLAVHPPENPSLKDLGREIVRQRISLLWLTASLFHQLVDEEPDALHGVGQLIAGGDVLSAAHVRRALEPVESRGGVLMNGYGPTENTTFTTCHSMDSAAEVGDSVPVGRPIPATTAHILDAAFEPVPVGSYGTLYTGGSGVAQSYLGRPAATAERFVPDPFSGQPGARLYDTGDLVHHRPDGTLLFHGRQDQQIKLRGFRIEIGEIESLLEEHEQVLRAVVSAPEDAAGQRYLVAHVVPHGAGEDLEEHLRDHLTHQLPPHMAPSLFRRHERLPRTPNGKVDRRALVTMAQEERSERSAGETWVAPRTAQEEVLANVWSEVLEVDRVGAFDDFFELGGHSLLATQVVSRIEQLFGVELPLRALFESPTPADLARQLATATQRRELPALEPLPRPDGLPAPAPLSFAQERLWFVDQLLPGQTHYNVPMAWRLLGALGVPRLAAALDGLSVRHEALRTRFHLVDEGPVQSVDAPNPVPLPEVDLRALGLERARQEASSLATAESNRPFDLEHGPLWRNTLLRIGTEEALLLTSMHHIVSDGWTVGLMLRELAELYEHPESQEPRDLQYVDFAHWQRGWLRGEALDELLGWWRDELRDLPTLDLPTDRPRPAVQAFRGQRRIFHLPDDLVQGLRHMAQERGATLFMVLLAAFETLLHRLTGQSDLAVGSPIANRHHRELEGMVGFFVNSLVLRTRFSGRPNFLEVLDRVGDAAFGAYAHQDLPFEQLVEALQPERHLNHNPLFQVLFTLNNAPLPPLRLGELTVEMVSQELHTTHFDLELNAWPMADGGGLRCAAAWDRDLFDPTTIERLTRRFESLLHQVIEDPRRPVHDLPLLSPAEAHQLGVEWAGVETAFPRDQTLDQLFAQTAQRHPDAIALDQGSEAWSYGHLAQKVDELAAVLRARGVGRDGQETPVALLVERSPRAVLGLLAILRAGGAYVPVDPSWPVERRAFLFDDLGIELALADQDLDLPVPTLSLDSSPEATGPAPDSTHLGGAQRLAYVMYTSGSTGQPKGIAMPHSAPLRLVLQSTVARFGSEERTLLFAPLSFDASCLELWAPLLHGGRLVIAPAGRPSFEELGQVLVERRVTMAWFTRGLFDQVVEGPLEALAGVKQLLVGGEALSAGHVRRALKASPGTVLTNGYGPTENGTFTAVHPMTDPKEVPDDVPIGRPVSNTSVAVMDAQLRPLPLGAKGELVTGGDGLARVYAGRPALTAAVFVPDPESTEPGARLYKTGDLARFGGDGGIQFFGRRDQQVKLRGFRIEPGEIEAALVEVKGVRQASVVVRDDVPGGRQLVAYLVPETAPEAAPIRNALGQRLPDFMVPGLFVRLPELPLNVNGKVEKRALPRPVLDSDPAQSVAPRNELEQAIATIWRQVLGAGDELRLGIHDNFFEVGGSSLTLARVHRHLSEELASSLALVDLFQYPTIGALAQRISAGTPDKKTFERARSTGRERQQALRRRARRRSGGRSKR